MRVVLFAAGLVGCAGSGLADDVGGSLESGNDQDQALFGFHESSYSDTLGIASDFEGPVTVEGTDGGASDYENCAHFEVRVLDDWHALGRPVLLSFEGEAYGPPASSIGKISVYSAGYEGLSEDTLGEEPLWGSVLVPNDAEDWSCGWGKCEIDVYVCAVQVSTPSEWGAHITLTADASTLDHHFDGQVVNVVDNPLF